MKTKGLRILRFDSDLTLYIHCRLNLLFLGSVTVVPTTVMPDNSAALATAEAKSVSARNEESVELVWSSDGCLTQWSLSS